MNLVRRLLVLAAAIAAVVTSAAPVAAQSPGASPFIGRWDVTITDGDRQRPSWLEVTLSGNRTLVGRFVADGGSARPVAKVEVADGTMRFAIPPQWERGTADLTFEASLDGTDALRGRMTNAEGRALTWTAKRAPTLRRAGAPTWGSPVTLFNGRDLTGWRASTGTNNWSVVNGILTNARGGANLITTGTYTDFKLRVEFRYPRNGNSGVYLRGRHEVQIEDSGGREQSSLNLGGVYGFLTPNQDVAKAAGEWQTMEITLVGRTVTVVLNGTAVICDQLIPGITGGALDSDEGAPGPIYLQGDHTAVEFRRIVLTPAR